jgi:hypothetical protein
MSRWTDLLPLACTALAAACGSSASSGASNTTGTGPRQGADAAVSPSEDGSVTGTSMDGSTAASGDASNASQGAGGGDAGDGAAGVGPSGEAGSTATSGTNPSMLPTVKGTCPAMANLNGTNLSFAGQSFTVWSSDPAKGPGPLLIYWHNTGSNSMEPTWAIQAPQIQRIVSAGGVVAAQVASTSSGQGINDNEWFTGDLDVADEVVACATAVQKVDVRRIWTAGYGSGGFASVYMWYARSGYIAGAISYSGGEWMHSVSFQDPSHVPVGVASHGGPGTDLGGDTLAYARASYAWEMDNPSAFIVDCDDGGNHGATGPRTAMAPQAIQMLWDHPYGITPEPYSGGLPASWPSTCVPPPVPANH